MIFDEIVITLTAVTSYLERSQVFSRDKWMFFQQFVPARTNILNGKDNKKPQKCSEFISKWLDFYVLPECVDKFGGF